MLRTINWSFWMWGGSERLTVISKAESSPQVKRTLSATYLRCFCQDRKGHDTSRALPFRSALFYSEYRCSCCNYSPVNLTIHPSLTGEQNPKLLPLEAGSLHLPREGKPPFSGQKPWPLTCCKFLLQSHLRSAPTLTKHPGLIKQTEPESAFCPSGSDVCIPVVPN